MWPLLVHLLLLLTAHVLSSLSVLAFHSIHSRRARSTPTTKGRLMLTMPAPMRQHLSGNVRRVCGSAPLGGRGGVPRAATRTQAPHIVCAERRVVSFSKN